jgi:hypothetical protein
LDASGDAWLTPNEAIPLERPDHLMDRWWADLKVVLQVGLGRRAAGAVWRRWSRTPVRVSWT